MSDEELVNELAPNTFTDQGVWEPPVEDEVRDEEGQENANISASFPIFEDLVEWFDEQIAITDSVLQARETAKMYDIDLETALSVHETIAKILHTQRDSLVARFESYSRNRDNAES